GRNGMLGGMRRLAVPVLVVLSLAACDSGPGDSGADAPSASPSSADPGSDDYVVLAGEQSVMVRIDAGDGDAPELYTLSCPREGDVFTTSSTLPDADAACAHLGALADPFAELPGDQTCTQVYGGSQTALIAGNWAGEDVRLELSRTDGCRIAQWDRLAPLLPVDVG
uniref:hypothetical protein n=1 Tax=Modestobacter roseus TaxID=1181884 RepID=UPI0034DED81F